MRRTFGLALVAAGLLGALGAGTSAAAPVPGSACTLFPGDNAWHADVRALPVHPKSAAWLGNMGGANQKLHPDFGPNGNDQPYGIPYTVVSGSKPKVAVEFDYADESDPGPYPLAADTPIEDGSDAHALIVDKDACRLYELFAVDWNGGQPTAGSGAIWDLRSNALRPDEWTSADAAGLPILAGLLRRDEVLAGEVDHAIRITAVQTDKSYLWPARHHAGAANNPSLPPMGARFRLKANFDMAGLRPDTVVVLRAMQKHGVIVADNGSNWYFTGTSEPGWDEDFLDELKSISAGAFEAVDASGLMVDANSGQIKASAVPASTTTTAPTTTTTRPPTTTTTKPPTTTTTKPQPTTTMAAPTTTTAAPTTTTMAPGAAIPVTVESSTTTTLASGEASETVPLRRSGHSGGRIALLSTLMVAAFAGAGAAGTIAWRRRGNGEQVHPPEER